MAMLTKGKLSLSWIDDQGFVSNGLKLFRGCFMLLRFWCCANYNVCCFVVLTEALCSLCACFNAIMLFDSDVAPTTMLFPFVLMLPLFWFWCCIPHLFYFFLWTGALCMFSVQVWGFFVKTKTEAYIGVIEQLENRLHHGDTNVWCFFS